MTDTLRLTDLRSYSTLDVAFGPGPHLVWGPNAAGKTSLLEAMVVLARGSSHRTTTDAELVRWASDVARIEGRAGADEIEVALVRPGSAAAASGARKRMRVNGVARDGVEDGLHPGADPGNVPHDEPPDVPAGPRVPAPVAGL